VFAAARQRGSDGRERNYNSAMLSTLKRRHPEMRAETSALTWIPSQRALSLTSSLIS
jgi:hypothetical protein